MLDDMNPLKKFILSIEEICIILKGVVVVKLRLRRMGAIDKPFYRIVAVDSRKKRDGKYLESVGYYDPKTDPFTLKIDTEKSLKWLEVGAQPSETVRSLLRKAGVLEKWHSTKFNTKSDKEAKKSRPEIIEEKQEIYEKENEAENIDEKVD